MNSVKNGLTLWFNCVLPALLPFMIGINILRNTPFPLVLSRLLRPVGNLLGTGSLGMFVIISGFLSGYPMGAKLVSELYGENRLTKREAQYLLSFTNNSGPLFIMGTVGAGLLNNRKAGIYLLLIHYLSALIIGIIMPKPNTESKDIKLLYTGNIGSLLKDSIYNGTEAIVLVGGYIIFFSIICTLLEKLLLRYSINFYVRSVLFGILEITNGCKEIKDISSLSLAIISLIIGFGGLSIHSQSIGYISSTNLSGIKYLMSKAVQGSIAFILSIVVYPFVF